MNENTTSSTPVPVGSALSAALPHVFKDMEDAVIVADEQRRILSANPAAEALFGYPPGAMAGQLSSVLYEHDSEFAAQGRQRFNRNATTEHKTYVTRYRRRDGSVFEGETTAGPIREPDSDQVFFLGIVRDASVRLSAERALHRLHQITSDRKLDFAARREAILRLGCEHFNLPIGIVSHIDGQRYEVLHAVHPDNALAPGTTFALGETYCCHTLAANAPLGFHQAGSSEIQNHPCYRSFALESYLGSPLDVDGVRYGTLNFSSPAPSRPFTGQDLELVALFAQWLGHEMARQADLNALAEAHDRLERAATTDELTGLANRRLLTSRLTQELQRCHRYGHELAVALIDYDHFKSLNDRYGHNVGDDALVHFAELASATVRDVDLIGRWGGEEFLALLPDTSVEGGGVIANRLGARVRETDFQAGGTRVPLSVSIGVAVSQPGDSVETLVKRADEALYEAKAAGRDCVRSRAWPVALRAHQRTRGR